MNDIDDADWDAIVLLSKAMLLLMNVSRCGKSTIAQELQRLHGWPFENLHRAANVKKMRSRIGRRAFC